MELQRNLWSYKEILNFGNMFTGKATLTKFKDLLNEK